MTMTVLHIASPFAVTLPEAGSNSSGGLAAPTKNDTSGRGNERNDHDRPAQSLDPGADVVISVVSTMGNDPFITSGSPVEAVIQAYLSLAEDATPEANRVSEARDDAFRSADEQDEQAHVSSDRRL